MKAKASAWVVVTCVSGAALAFMQVLWSRGESLDAVDFAALQPFCMRVFSLW